MWYEDVDLIYLFQMSFYMILNQVYSPPIFTNKPLNSITDVSSVLQTATFRKVSDKQFCMYLLLRWLVHCVATPNLPSHKVPALHRYVVPLIMLLNDTQRAHKN